MTTRATSAADWQRFDDQVCKFIQRHWRPRAAPGEAPAGQVQLQQWRRALQARGWQLPHWPAQHGGAGWSLRQRYLWEQRCAQAGIPADDDTGVQRVAPLLWTWGDARQQQRWLPLLANRSRRWCVPLLAAAPLAAAEINAVLHTDADGLRLTGHWPAVADGLRAQMLAVPARWLNASFDGPPVLVVVLLSAQHAALRRRAVTLLDGSAAAAVSVDHMPVATDAVLGVEAAPAAVQRLLQPGIGELALATRLQAAAHALRSAAAQAPAGGGTLLDPGAGSFAARLAALEIELLALEGGELRVLADASAASDFWRDHPACWQLLLHHEHIQAQLSDLLAETFGYHALPWPTDVAFDNEPPVGPAAALAGVRAMLRGRAGGYSAAGRVRLALALHAQLEPP